MMKRTLLAFPLLILFAACGAKETKEHDNDGSHASHREGSEASHENDSDKEAHGDEHNDHGKRQSLGKLTAFGRSFEVVQYGAVEAGAEAAFELEFASGKERIHTARAWIGIESGEGAMKAKMGIEGKTNMHGHIEVPKPIPADSKLWLELDVDGKVETLSAAFK